jgi:hypothetical protein
VARLSPGRRLLNVILVSRARENSRSLGSSGYESMVVRMAVEFDVSDVLPSVHVPIP